MTIKETFVAIAFAFPIKDTSKVGLQDNDDVFFLSPSVKVTRKQPIPFPGPALYRWLTLPQSPGHSLNILNIVI